MFFIGDRSGAFAPHGIDNSFQHRHRVVHPGTAHGGDGRPEVAAEVVTVAAVGGEGHVGGVIVVHQGSACREDNVCESVPLSSSGHFTRSI